MKQNGTALNTVGRKLEAGPAGDEHFATNKQTPMHARAFELENEEKKYLIEGHFKQIMNILGLDLGDDSLKETPKRVAKMFVDEVFSGLNPDNKPEVKLFDNKYKYGEMLVEKNITVYSYCEHHFVPIIGKALVAYISNGNVIGLSKINRIVDYYARRPQVQERLTEQIAEELKRVLGTEDVAVMIDASHLCVASRGVRDTESTTVTAHYGGRFKENNTRRELFQYIGLKA